MFNATSQVDNALKIFTKAEAKLEAAVDKAHEEEAKALEAIKKQEAKIEQAKAARNRATSALSKIKLILGGE